MARRDREARGRRPRGAGDVDRARIPRRSGGASSRRSTSPTSEWADLTAAQSRLANAADLIAAATQGSEALTEGDDALAVRLAQLTQRLKSSAVNDPALADVVALLEPAAVELDEAARALRDYLRRLDLDPEELERVEGRLAAIHDIARTPSRAPRSVARAAGGNRGAPRGARRIRRCRCARPARGAKPSSSYRAARRAAVEKAPLRRDGARASRHRGDAGAAHGRAAASKSRSSRWPRPRATDWTTSSSASRRIPKQPLGPLARVASGGELSRIALAIQVVASEVGQIPTLVFDEVDSGIGGAVAATVGAAAADARLGPAGAVRHAPAAGGRVRRRAFPRQQDGQRARA